jgi:hypothetical protein
MKTILKHGLVAGAICLGLAGCQEKDDTVFEASVYTTLDAEQGHSLYVDGALKGAVPSMAAGITCDSTTLMANCLHFTLPAGRHKVELWNAAGAAVSGFTLKVYENSTSVRSEIGDNGGGAVHVSGTCLVMRMD